MIETETSSNAIELLLQDHREVEALFREYDSIKDEDEEAAMEVIEATCLELTIHDDLEMSIFYPAVRQHADEQEIEDLLDEAEVEHDTARDLIDKLEQTDLADEKRRAHFRVLMEFVTRHVKAEEEELFPWLEELDGIDLEAIGVQLQQRKHELRAELVAEDESDERA